MKKSGKRPKFNRFLKKPKISDLYPECPVIYKLLQVSSDEDSNLRILDEVPEDNLILVHYLEPTLKTRHIRGVIIDVFNEQIVVESFPYTEEMLPTSKLVKDIPIGGNQEVTKAFEGTILRVFRGRVTHKWYISTHRKIDGRRSRWAGPPFGEMFDSLWGSVVWEDYLSPNSCYVFLLSHGDNRLVCQISEPCIHHVQTFQSIKGGQMVATFKGLLKEHPNVKIQVVLDIKSVEELIEETEKLDWRDCSGLLVTQYEERPEGRVITACWKVVPESYQEKRGIRGNEPNFRFRYLQLRKEEKDRTSQIRELFPEKKELFDAVEKYILELPEFLAGFYKERYEKDTFVYLPKEIHHIITTTRQAYAPDLNLCDNLKENMELGDARQLNALIRFMLEERRTDNKNESQETSNGV